MGRTPLLLYVFDVTGNELSARDYDRPRRMGHAPLDFCLVFTMRCLRSYMSLISLSAMNNLHCFALHTQQCRIQCSSDYASSSPEVRAVVSGKGRLEECSLPKSIMTLQVADGGRQMTFVCPSKRPMESGEGLEETAESNKR